MISEYANKEATEEILSRSPELQRFVFEFCKAFDCRVAETDQWNAYSRHGVQVLTNTGLPCGYLYVDLRGATDKDHNHVTTYNFKSPIVEKERSDRTSRDTRNSIKIASLIAAVRKCGEEPTNGGMARSYKQGIRYAHTCVQANQRAVRLDMPADAIVAMVEHYIGKVETKASALVTEVRSYYNEYLKRKHAAEESDKNTKRFQSGAITIGYMTDTDKPYYVVGRTIFDPSEVSDEQVKFQGHLKRYSSLYDCPEVAPHIPIIRAWAEGQIEFSKDNELGLPRRDIYHADIDVASGYATAGQTWFLIPTTAP